MLGKLGLRWMGPYWILNEENGTYQLGTLSGEVVTQSEARRGVLSCI
jgi:hypothetical protein